MNVQEIAREIRNSETKYFEFTKTYSIMKRKGVNKMKKYEVRFDGGESRSTYNGEIIGVDYMLVEVPILENEDENIELYAELPADDEKNYDELKAEILRQAKEHGYTEENFTFWYD